MAGKDSLKYLGVDGRIILEMILKKSVGRAWTDYIRFACYGPMAGSCEHGNELSGSTK
jgi:hypothetical protein